jgi:hypothetical protein
MDYWGDQIDKRRLRWAEVVARMGGDVHTEFRVLVGKPEERGPFVIPYVDERIILKWILEKWVGRV